MSLGRLTWPEVAESQQPYLALPIGSCEQHGPHLPLDTDTRIANTLAEQLARRRPDVVVAPALAYGASGEHAGFPGTLSIGQAALELVLVELGRSADAFRGLVIVNGHGGNVDTVARAVRQLLDEGRRATAWSPRVPGGDAHAGRTETSLLLALAPAEVRLEVAAAGPPTPLPELLGALRSRGVAAVSPNGVLGDPAGATADEGQSILAALADDLIAHVHAWINGFDHADRLRPR